MSNVIIGILVVWVGVYFYKKINKKSPCCSETDVKTEAEAFEELKNTVESSGEIKIIDEIKSADENKKEELEKVSKEINIKKEELEKESKEINIKKFEVTVENLPDIIEMYRPNQVSMEIIKSFAKDIYNKQVEPLSYATIYKCIADSYGYRTWKDFKNTLETK